VDLQQVVLSKLQSIKWANRRRFPSSSLSSIVYFSRSARTLHDVVSEQMIAVFLRFASQLSSISMHRLLFQDAVT
jgi:hypothetical protein